MKREIIAMLAAAVAFQAVAEDKSQPKPAATATVQATAETQAEKPLTPEEVSYAIGLMFGSQMRSYEYDYKFDELQKGMKDILSGGATKLTESQAQSIIQRWRMEQNKVRGEKNKSAGAAFLAENAKKASIKTTASGLQYEVLKEGNGKSPTASDTVKVHYRGTLINGTEFDSSFKRNAPAEFPVGGVIKGWTEALQLMKPGAKWKLYIPSELAYGERGTPSIPPNSTLIFEVELLEVKEAPKKVENTEAVQAVSGEIIKVPSAEELKKGAKIEVLKEADVKRMLQTNQAAKPATQPEKK